MDKLTFLTTDEELGKSQLSRYVIVPIQLPKNSKLDINQTIIHYIYVRQNEPRIPTESSYRSLFVSNVPVDASESSLRGLFNQIGAGKGRVEKVTFDIAQQINNERQAPTAILKSLALLPKSIKRKRDEIELERLTTKLCKNPLVKDQKPQPCSSGTCAVITFADISSMKNVLKECRKVYPGVWRGVNGEKRLTWKETDVPLGTRLIRQQLIATMPDDSRIEQAVNSYLEAFGNLEKLRDNLMARGANKPDEQGFITVVRHSKLRAASVLGAKAALQRAHSKRLKKLGPTAFTPHRIT